MLQVLLNIGVFTFFFILMEFIARLTHKYIMHGLLWKIHEDHHRDKQSEIEKNDFFGLVFAIVALFLLLKGLISNNPLLFYAGLGITGYGISYFIIHDMIIHDRHIHLRSWGLKHEPFRLLILTHDIHHANGEGNWGFLFVIRGIDKLPLEYEHIEAKR
ncbi:sterol desaturase family protein [Sulfolobus tengchongensis]|uniref:Sterol desaturase family protein n=1 Tax=Sulfolobus tengchongensis TaxID=207809 RepID=A0AAX4KX30_9CREN